MIRLLAFLPLLAAAGQLSAQRPPAPPPATEEIVVKGKREREREITRFVDALTPSRLRGQLVRFAQPVCPGAVGLAAAQNRAVVARLRVVAATAGVPLAKEPACKPNLLVMVTDDKLLLARRIRAALANPGLESVAVPATSGPAIVLHLEGQRDANGQMIGVKEESGDGRSGYGEVEVFTSDRIRPGTSPTFLASIMVIEPAALDGLTTVQLADHAAMRLLARTDPARVPASAPTILSILDAPIGTQVPITLTTWDLAFLKGLYASTDRTYSGAQRREIRDRLRKDLERPRD